MPLIQFVHDVVDQLNRENERWMAALFYEQIDPGRFWAMVYRNTWSSQRPRAQLHFHELYNPTNLPQNNMSPHLWFQIECVDRGMAGMPPYDVYVPVDLYGVNDTVEQMYLETMGLFTGNLQNQPNGWSPTAYQEAVAFLADHHRKQLDDQTVVPLVDDDQSLNNCVQFVLQRFETLPYD